LALGMPDARTIRLFWQAKGWPIVEVTAAALAASKPHMLLDPGETEVLGSRWGELGRRSGLANLTVFVVDMRCAASVRL
jgi:hypothetical protein